MSMNAAILALQLALTLVILAFVPGNALKAALLLLIWAVTFRRVSLPELVMFAVACVFFSVMNTMSLAQGIFAFRHPNLLGMPWYEFFMWGFYLLHTKRMVGGHAPLPTWQAGALAVAYAIAFSLIPDQNALLAVTGGLLIGGLVIFHERFDLAYTGYMILLGAMIEYTGVHSGQWYYPGDPPGGVPMWFITLWGGVGLLLRRLVLPVVARFERPA